MNVPPRRAIALTIALLWNLVGLNAIACTENMPCGADPPCPVYIQHAKAVSAEPAAPSWIFRRGTYTHDPYSGARVAQYAPIEPIEPLDDPRLVTSRYRRSRTNLRGHDGSIDTYYEVQAWGNGRGGLDAEWERFHDAWKESYLSGGWYNQGQNSYNAPYGGPVYGGGYGLPGYGFPGYGAPGYGAPGYGYPPGYGGFPGGGPHYGDPHGDGGHHDHDD